MLPHRLSSAAPEWLALASPRAEWRQESPAQASLQAEWRALEQASLALALLRAERAPASLAQARVLRRVPWLARVWPVFPWWFGLRIWPGW